ncbi:recombinase family protein, partial [Mesorhizobium sp. A556]
SDADEDGSTAITLEMPILLKRRGNEQRLIIDSGFAPLRTPDPALVDLMAKAHLFFGKLTERPNTSIAEIAKSFGIDRADVGRILPLAFLAPKIVESVLQGTQRQNLSPRALARMHLPLLWADQAAAIQ